MTFLYQQIDTRDMLGKSTTCPTSSSRLEAGLRVGSAAGDGIRSVVIAGMGVRPLVQTCCGVRKPRCKVPCHCPGDYGLASLGAGRQTL